MGGTIRYWGNRFRARDGKYRQVTVGNGHACAITLSDTIVCWGADRYGQLEAPDGTFVQIATGEHHSCAITVKDAFVCWGRNRYGETNAPGSEPISSVPTVTLFDITDEQDRDLRSYLDGDKHLMLWFFAPW